MTFAACIWRFCVQFSFDLVTLTFDPWPWRCPTIQLTYQFLASYEYPFLRYGWLNLITLSSHGTVNAHVPCRVTYHWGRGKMVHIFEIPDLNFPIHFVTFGVLRQRLSHVICKKWRFPNLKAVKFSANAQLSRDLCVGGPPKLHVTIFWPQIIYSLYNFYGATTTIKGCLYWSIPMLKQFSAAKKTKSSPKISAQYGGFSEI